MRRSFLTGSIHRRVLLLHHVLADSITRDTKCQRWARRIHILLVFRRWFWSWAILSFIQLLPAPIQLQWRLPVNLYVQRARVMRLSKPAATCVQFSQKVRIWSERFLIVNHEANLPWQRGKWDTRRLLLSPKVHPESHAERWSWVTSDMHQLRGGASCWVPTELGELQQLLVSGIPIIRQNHRDLSTTWWCPRKA